MRGESRGKDATQPNSLQVSGLRPTVLCPLGQSEATSKVDERDHRPSQRKDPEDRVSGSRHLGHRRDLQDLVEGPEPELGDAAAAEFWPRMRCLVEDD